MFINRQTHLLFHHGNTRNKFPKKNIVGRACLFHLGMARVPYLPWQVYTNLTYQLGPILKSLIYSQGNLSSSSDPTWWYWKHNIYKWNRICQRNNHHELKKAYWPVTIIIVHPDHQKTVCPTKCTYCDLPLVVSKCRDLYHKTTFFYCVLCIDLAAWQKHVLIMALP